MTVADIKLNSGQKIPQIGLGLWQVKDLNDVETSVKTALEAGYTHFDSAQAYGNEGMLAEALNKAGTKREDVFITTKISVAHFAPFLVKSSFDKSLKKLETDYVDLLLLHFPVTLLRNHAWHDLEDIHEAGKAKSIGVSNFTINHLEELLAESKIVPALNQVELHVYLQQPELLAYCRDKGIAVEAYSPLAHGYGMDDPVLAAIATKHHKSSAQVMLRWCIEKGTIPLPKSTHAERIKENMAIFDFSLDEDDMNKLTALDKNYHTCWDPTNVK